MSGLRPPKVEIVSLIYRSTAYAAHIVSELAQTRSEKCDLSWRLVANDPTPEVASFLVQESVCHTIYNDPKPDDYYLNRVYRAWNAAGASSKAEIVCFVNSDMMFSEGWLDALIDCWNAFQGQVIPCSLLLESGRMTSKPPAMTCRFGETLETFDRNMFLKAAYPIRKDILFWGGLYMPCLLPQVLFDKNHESYFPYPEGNIYRGGIGATDTEFVDSGDSYFFDRLYQKFGLVHLTVGASVVAHLQSGEMAET